MGMFDDITNVPLNKCVSCGAALHGWQSKDSLCTLSRIPFWHVGNFYTSCDKCGMWHEYTEKQEIPRPERPITDYQLKVRGKNDDWNALRIVEPRAEVSE